MLAWDLLGPGSILMGVGLAAILLRAGLGFAGQRVDIPAAVGWVQVGCGGFGVGCEHKSQISPKLT